MSSQPDKLLGDRVAAALAKLGITDERFSKLMGKPCKCGQRKAWLNRLDLWARRVLSGKIQDAEIYLKEIKEDE